MKTLTVFTPAYNRKHTIGRTFESLCRQTSNDFEWLIIDDGSSDGTKEWVESLGEKIELNGVAFDWMGRKQNETTDRHFVVEVGNVGELSLTMRIEYVYKPNGGLYTGYNVAYAVIKTELCVCIDSDDFMPDNAVELIIKKWNQRENSDKQKIGGIAGLDFNVINKRPIGGHFNKDEEVGWVPDLHHQGDCKFVFRTELMRSVAPQIGFEGEKDFNPHYMQMQILDKYPMYILNENICWVEYQIGADSMSQAIFKQYVRSPRSYAKYRLLEMILTRENGFLNRLRLCIHYVSSCLFAHDSNWLRNCPQKILAIISVPFSILLSIFIMYKSRRS